MYKYLRDMYIILKTWKLSYNLDKIKLVLFAATGSLSLKSKIYTTNFSIMTVLTNNRQPDIEVVIFNFQNFHE